MLEFQEKRKIRKYLYSRVTLFILIILIILSLKAVWEVYEKQDMTRDNLVKTAASLEGLQARSEILSAEIERLKTEAGVEAEIRSKYGLVREGEEVIVVVDNDLADQSSTSTPISFWQKVLDWLK